VLLKVFPVIPVSMLFLRQIIWGEEPALTAFAVKDTNKPGQVIGPALMFSTGVSCAVV
jgi:hypothetical protein